LVKLKVKVRYCLGFLTHHVQLLKFIAITENDELSAARVGGVRDTALLLSAEIDSGVSELNWTDVEVMCDVRSVSRISHPESQWNIRDKPVAVVDEVFCTMAEILTRDARTVVPRYDRAADITAALKRHR